MKQTVLSLLLAGAVLTGRAQAITDTVSHGATASGVSYPNQVWYSLPNDEQGTRPRAEWDLAFDLKNITSGVLTNSTAGVTLWKYWKANLATGWNAVDTSGLATRPARYNSDTSWALGAIGRYANPLDPYNLDWGTYNMTTHTVTGDSLYILRLGNGTYKKFAIESLIGGVYTFKFANLDGSGAQSQTLTKSSYTGKNFVYFNLTSNTFIDREPPAANWDLTFLQYTASVMGQPYGVTGILQKQGVQVAKVSNLPNAATDTVWSTRAFSTAINGIGYDWKTFTGTTYAIKDSTIYFVKRTNGDVWKVILKGFAGSSTGKVWFTKEKIYTASVVTAVGDVTAAAATLVLYPNPAAGQDVHLIYDFAGDAKSARVQVQSLTGQTVYAAPLEGAGGLRTTLIPASRFAAGTYLVSVENGSRRTVQKLLVP